jgi:hypothetical protein
MQVVDALLRRQSEDLDGRPLGMNQGGGFHTTISGIETSIRITSGPEQARLGDRFESIGRRAHDLKRRLRLQQFTEGSRIAA